MFNFISSPISIGLEHSSNCIKAASVIKDRKGPSLTHLFTFDPQIEDVKRLYTHHPFITTGLRGKEVLVRSLNLPLTKEKDIEEALIFQAEPLLPYPAEEAFLAYQVVSKTGENTDLTLLAARKETIQSHVESWQALHIEPEKIASLSSALSEFATHYLPNIQTCLILHLQQQEMTCVLVKEGKLLASFAQPIGINLLWEAQAIEGLDSLPQNEEEWRAIEEKGGTLSKALKQLQKEVTKMGYALAKEVKAGSIEGVIVTGEGTHWLGFDQVLIESLHLPLLTSLSTPHYSSRELLEYAVPIGLALGSLPGCQSACIDFRQEESSYPYPWRRLKVPIALYFAAIFLLTCAFSFFSQQYLSYQESQFQQSYIDLLAGMNKTHKDFEQAFVTKNPQAHEAFQNEIPKIEQLNQEELMQRLAFLQKELQSTPDSFPLFANTPRVSDVLAWLSQHPAAIWIDEDGNRHPKWQIEHFSYTMLKRPQQGKKQEKYQVKVELELSSPTPKWAREFHDALIAPNNWVDPKGEVKWGTNRGKYKTSFFLKDKTAYPSL